MRLAFIVDPLADLKIYKDTSVAMMAAAQAAGHDVFCCEVADLVLADGHVSARWLPIRLTGKTPDWFEAGAPVVMELAAFDAVLMRKDPPFDDEFLYATHLLDHARRAGGRIVNDPRALRDHNEKLAITEFAHLIAPTLVTRDPVRLRTFVHEHGEAVFKLLDGMGGASIFRARHDDPNLSVIIETMNRFGTRTVMAQRYLPAIADGDKRILLINGKVVPHALARVPKAGESRGNLAAGGTARVQPLSARDRAIAEELAPVLSARGLFLVGLDVIGDCLTEINVTSPTGFREIADQSGFDVAAMFIRELESGAGRSGRETRS